MASDFNCERTMPTNEGLSFCSRCDREHSAAMPHDDEFNAFIEKKDMGWRKALDRTRGKPDPLKALPKSA